MRILVTGGTGVLGQAVLPLLAARRHEVDAPGHDELDLFDAASIAGALAGCDAVMHLATRIPSLGAPDDAVAWRENDRLRSESSRLLVDAGLAAGVQVYVQPTIALLYPVGLRADEDTPLGSVPPPMRSALAAEAEAARFAAAGRRGLALRLGLLDGPGTGHSGPNGQFGASLNATDAGTALAAALTAPSGLYNVTRDDERVSNTRFKRVTGWRPAS